MFEVVKVSHSELAMKRNELKSDGYISSVAIAAKIRNGEIKINITSSYFFTKLKNFVKKSENYHSIMLNISGTVKWWYKENDIENILNEIDA